MSSIKSLQWWLALAVFLLSTMASITAGVASGFFQPIIDSFATRADNAGWNQKYLLPHQIGLWIAINGTFFLVILIAVVSAFALVILTIRSHQTRVTNNAPAVDEYTLVRR